MTSPALTLIYKQPKAAFKFRLGKRDGKCAEILGFERHAVNYGHRLGKNPRRSPPARAAPIYWPAWMPMATLTASTRSATQFTCAVLKRTTSGIGRRPTVGSDK